MLNYKLITSFVNDIIWDIKHGFSCDQSYHEECFRVLKLKCNHCYLSGVIDDLTKSYNERPNMDDDIDDELDLELDSQSDGDDINATDVLNIDKET